MAKASAKAKNGRDVDAVFGAYPPALRRKLLALRRLVLDTARKTEGVGPIEETLKWGQPSFVTSQTGSGSTIRIDAVKPQPGRYAMYFHCQTNLVAAFRQIYPKEFVFDGNRAILFDAAQPVPQEPLRHCIKLALTYHSAKRKSL